MLVGTSIGQQVQFLENSTKIERYSSLTKKFVRKSKDSLLHYGQKTLKVADQLDNNQLKRQAYYDIGYYYSRSGVFDTAVPVFKSALAFYQQVKDSTGIGKTKNQLGHIYWLQGDHLKAKRFFEDAISIHKRFNNPKELGKSLTNLANLYTRWGDYNRSIGLLLEAIDHYVAVDFTEGLAWLDFSMSLLYKRVGEYKKALDYVNSALKTYQKIAETSGDSIGIRICYTQIGFLYIHHLDSLGKGLEYQKKALRLAQKLDLKSITADGLTGVGQTYYKMGKYKQAYDYLLKAYNYRKESGIVTGSSSNLKYLGYIHEKWKEFDEAEAYYNRSLDFTFRINNRSIRNDVYRAMSGLYEKQKKYKKSLAFLKKYISLSDSILSNDVAKKVASTQLKHEIERKERENKLLLQQNKIQKLQINEARLLRNILIGSVIFVIILLLFIVYLYHKRKQIKSLKGLIPICANCKKIRNDKGFYEHLEKYISEHTDANFSHGICPDCMKEMHPDIYAKMQEKKKKKV